MKEIKNKQTSARNHASGNSAEEQKEVSKFVKITSDKYFKFGFVTLLYLLWSWWVGNWWLLLGVPVLFDIYVTKKVNWTFWKRRNGPNGKVVEWIDALIFAVIAVTLINIFVFQNYKIPTGSMEKTLQIGDHLFVSKLKYGPRIPNTPLSFPFAQHTMPLTKSVKSYAAWPRWPYKRLTGFTHIKNDDIVVFNFPEGDTVLLADQVSSYYAIVRHNGERLRNDDQMRGNNVSRPFTYYKNVSRKQILKEYEIIVRPVDKRENYIKRCVAIPGDTLTIVNTQVYINGKPQEQFEKMQHRYAVQTDGSRINERVLERLDIYKDDETVRMIGNSLFSIPLVEANVEAIRKLPNVRSVEKMIVPAGAYDSEIFPHDARYPWNMDNFGPLWIPKKGATVKIDTSNISIYERIIAVYEANDLKIQNGEIFINGTKAAGYTFKMDYYWMMGDNRHESLDSRFWGFVPEDHVVGAPRFVWLALNKEKMFPFNIRFSRMFRSAGR